MGHPGGKSGRRAGHVLPFEKKIHHHLGGRNRGRFSINSIVREIFHGFPHLLTLPRSRRRVPGVQEQWRGGFLFFPPEEGQGFYSVVGGW